MKAKDYGGRSPWRNVIRPVDSKRAEVVCAGVRRRSRKAAIKRHSEELLLRTLAIQVNMTSMQLRQLMAPHIPMHSWVQWMARNVVMPEKWHAHLDAFFADLDAPHPVGLIRCESCREPLLERGGFHGTDLCGPCCTGEARTAGMLSADDPGTDDEETKP